MHDVHGAPLFQQPEKTSFATNLEQNNVDLCHIQEHGVPTRCPTYIVQSRGYRVQEFVLTRVKLSINRNISIFMLGLH